MRRISTATRVANKFGAGKDGFTNGDAVGGIAATDLEDVWFDHVQEEISNVVEGAGLTLDNSNRAQLLAAIQAMFSPVVGSVRNLSMSVSAASATATMTADEIIVATALTGRTYRIASFNKTINLGATGAGGMDTGAAPASGFVALYAIYNPTTGASALLATNATSAAQPAVYGGANMPSGYTASALISVWPTTSGSLLAVGAQKDRWVAIQNTVFFTTTVVNGSLTPQACSAIPKNAIEATGTIYASSTATGGVGVSIAATTTSVGTQTISGYTASSTNLTGVWRLAIANPQVLYISTVTAGGTTTTNATVSGYSI